MTIMFLGTCRALIVLFALAGTAVAGSIEPPPIFKKGDYKLRLDAPFTGWNMMPPSGWQPAESDAPLGQRLPFDWDDIYKNRFNQHFQPVKFFSNAMALCNYQRRHPEEKVRADSLFAEMLSLLDSMTAREGDALFVLNNFDFPRTGVTIPKGWVGALANAFIAAGLMKYSECDNREKYLNLASGYIEAFRRIHWYGAEASARWISYIDKEGYIWFDEYPLPEGKATMVLNGHIISIATLALFAHKTGDESLIPLISGGIKSVQDNLSDFRRKGEVNLYDRYSGRPDYAPARTVRQQCELYQISGDAFFRDAAVMFTADFIEGGIDLPEHVLSRC